MGSFYGLGSWSRLPIQEDEKVFITTNDMKNPIVAKYFDYGEIYNVEICGDFEIRDKNDKIILSSNSHLREIEKFINDNLKRPNNEKTEYDLYVDHLFLYENIVKKIDITASYYNNIFRVLSNNYIYPDNSCFCASQDDISEIQKDFYNSIANFINEKYNEFQNWR